MKIGELFVKLGIQADEQKAKDFFNVIQNGKFAMLGLLSAAVGTSIGIASMWEKVMGSSMALSQFNAQTGLSVMSLQKWQNVGEAMGDTVENVTSSILTANTNLKNLKMFGTGTGASAYALLGIQPQQIKDVWHLIDILQKKIKSGSIDKTVMAQRLQEMGFSGTWMKTLMADTGKYANYQSMKSQEQIDNMVRVEAQMKNLGQTITSVFSDVFVQLSPQITATITSFARWITNHKKDIESAFSLIGANAMKFLKEIGNMAQTIDGIVASTMGWKNALLGIAGLYIAFNPLLRTMTAIFGIMMAISYLKAPQSEEETKEWGKQSGDQLKLKRIGKFLEKTGTTFTDYVNGMTPSAATAGAGGGGGGVYAPVYNISTSMSQAELTELLNKNERDAARKLSANVEK